MKLYLHNYGIFHNLNKYLRIDFEENFLISSIILLNNAIRGNFKELKYDNSNSKKCFRKANLNQEEFDAYFDILQGKNKTFYWKSFVSANKNLSNFDIKNNINSSIYENYEYNTIFNIEFSNDTWGLDISKFSSDIKNDEILLPAMSYFVIKNIEKRESDEIILIDLVKLDRNSTKNSLTLNPPKAKSSTLHSNDDHRRNSNINRNNSLLHNLLLTIEKEIVIMKNEVEINNDNYCFFQDDKDLLKIKIAINAPVDSYYTKGIFQVDICIREGYPSEKPGVKFLTKIFHPNISFENGDLDEEILAKIWRPSLSIAKFVGILRNLLIKPNEDFKGNNTEAKIEFRKNIKNFGKLALENTRKFADFSGMINEFKNGKVGCDEYHAKLGLLKEDKFANI